MNKLLTAIFAILLIAGALSAISGLTSIGSTQSVAIVGEGSSPFPLILSSASSPGDSSSLVDKY